MVFPLQAELFLRLGDGVGALCELFRQRREPLGWLVSYVTSLRAY